MECLYHVWTTHSKITVDRSREDTYPSAVFIQGRAKKGQDTAQAVTENNCIQYLLHILHVLWSESKEIFTVSHGYWVQFDFIHQIGDAGPQNISQSL